MFFYVQRNCSFKWAGLPDGFDTRFVRPALAPVRETNIKEELVTKIVKDPVADSSESEAAVAGEAQTGIDREGNGVNVYRSAVQIVSQSARSRRSNEEPQKKRHRHRVRISSEDEDETPVDDEDWVVNDVRGQKRKKGPSTADVSNLFRRMDGPRPTHVRSSSAAEDDRAKIRPR